MACYFVAMVSKTMKSINGSKSINRNLVILIYKVLIIHGDSYQPPADIVTCCTTRVDGGIARYVQPLQLKNILQ